MSQARSFAERYLAELKSVLDATPAEDVARFLDVLTRAHRESSQVFIVGNGGSAATASHMANDLVWGLARKGARPMHAIALTDNVALMTAIANDDGYGAMFVHQLEALGRRGDVLIAISGSGRSENVVRAIERARAMGMVTIGILGMDGGPARALVDVAVVVPSNDYGPIEDVHMALDHLALAFLRSVIPHA